MGFGKMNKLSPGSNMRWESSRMMLPEHVEALRLHKREGMRKQRPEFDEQQVEEIGWKLQEAMESKKEVEITLFGEFEDKIVVGIVTRVDTQLMRVRVEYEEDYDWIPIGDILGIE